MRRCLLACVGLIALLGTAWAADNDPAARPASPAGPPGYLDLHAGFGGGSENGTFGGGAFAYDESWNESVFGAAGRGALPVSANLTLQLDAWINAYNANGRGTDTESGPYDWDVTVNFPGIGTHLTYRTPDGAQLGALASIGGEGDYGMFANIGVEATHNLGRWRLYGQAGHYFAVSDSAAEDNAGGWYGHGILAYYLNPDLSVSGNLGYGTFTNDFLTGRRWAYGARIEYRPPALPLTGYVAVQGWNWSSTDDHPDSSGSNEYAIVVGTRLLLNRQTIRSADMDVGLMDMNIAFGDEFPH